MKNTKPVNAKKEVSFFKSISGKLIVILIPLITIITITLMAFILSKAESVIVTATKDSLDN